MKQKNTDVVMVNTLNIFAKINAISCLSKLTRILLHDLLCKFYYPYYMYVWEQILALHVLYVCF